MDSVQRFVVVTTITCLYEFAHYHLSIFWFDDTHLVYLNYYLLNKKEELKQCIVLANILDNLFKDYIY